MRKQSWSQHASFGLIIFSKREKFFNKFGRMIIIVCILFMHQSEEIHNADLLQLISNVIDSIFNTESGTW